MTEIRETEIEQLPLTRFLAGLRQWIKWVFQVAEWLLIVVAFQYVGKKFGFVAATTAGILLGWFLGIYLGLAIGRAVIPFLHLPLRSKRHEIAAYATTGLLAACVAALVIFITKEMITAQLLGAR